MLTFHPHCVPSSPGACLPPQPCLFKPECSSPTQTMSIRARTLASHLEHVPSSLSACSLACVQNAKEDNEERAAREQQIYSFPCNYLKLNLCIDSTTGKCLVKREGKRKKRTVLYCMAVILYAVHTLSTVMVL